ncbi:acyltransferase [Paucibacter sp. R3-3]|uniref:Acyltransferase n=1 Tax=Roseateles agri TaxID=3098619 RepID=A0ABU5DF65_9BURK|nr:acyltransferase [Paucibacter sp. R3-3]MDY0744919.1 acyltransferase [Paucibacter sp. R3-3]
MSSAEILARSAVLPSRRLPHVDALKACAAQMIVLHHLAAYGPIADAVQSLLPEMISWLYRYARMAVQVFLVVGGFLSARALCERGQVLRGAVPELLWRRYLRLAPAFMAAVLLTLLCSSLVAPWLPELAPESVSFGQLLSHGLLLHDVLGHEALTVGAWYVAVDFQLFAMLVGLLWLARSFRRASAVLLVLAAGVGSLFVFNRMPELDAWAPYFFGSYSLGVLVQWLSRLRSGWLRRMGLMLLALTVLLALALEFRERIVVAGVTALVLAVLQQRHLAGRVFLATRRRSTELAGRLGTRSYSLFLVHFPVCLLVNGLFAALGLHGAAIGIALMATALGLSNVASVPFHRYVEQPAGRIRLSGLLPRSLRDLVA